MNIKSYVFVLSVAIMTTGCASNQNMPLVFGQSRTVGISIGSGVSEQGVDFAFGYNDKNIAIVPVAIPVSEGNYAQVGSMSGEKFEDSFSVLGQFEVTTKSPQNDVGLGTFFATGAAAKALADGFADKLKGEAAKYEGNVADSVPEE